MAVQISITILSATQVSGNERKPSNVRINSATSTKTRRVVRKGRLIECLPFHLNGIMCSTLV